MSNPQGQSDVSSGRPKSNNRNRNRNRKPRNNRASPSDNNNISHKHKQSQTNGGGKAKRAKTDNCFQFTKTGTCSRGDDCRFLHVPKQDDGDVLMEDAAVAKPLVPSTATQKAHITDKRFADLSISNESKRAMQLVFQYEYMTLVQAETLPTILQGNDCLAKAKTGTGKTLAFLIPAVERLITNNKNNNGNSIGCLVLSPTRELALQISQEATSLTRFHNNIKVATFVGGTNMNKDKRALEQQLDILVATPGRLLDHLQNGTLTQRLQHLQVLVLDEADQLLDMGFRPDIERILALLQPSKDIRQTLLFSATVPDSVSEIARIALKPSYAFVNTVGQDEEQTHLHVQQELMVTDQAVLVQAVEAILANEIAKSTGGTYKIIVFFTTARLTGFMADLFNKVSSQTGIDVLEIHSRKSQPQRKKASDRFRDAKRAVLFSSDVSARGMDYPDVTHVLQVGITDRAQYIHRLGRTARAGKEGSGSLLLATYEEAWMRKELSDMPLNKVAVPELTKYNVEDAMQMIARDKELKVSAEQAYRAWLGYYNGNLKKVRWDKKQLVFAANQWAKQVGLPEQPSILKRTVGKMGLKGTPGLKLE